MFFYFGVVGVPPTIIKMSDEKFWEVPEYLLVELKENISLPLDILYMIEDVLWWDEKYRAKKRWVNEDYPEPFHWHVMNRFYPTIADMEGWYQRHIEDRRTVWLCQTKIKK